MKQNLTESNSIKNMMSQKVIKAQRVLKAGGVHP